MKNMLLGVLGFTVVVCSPLVFGQPEVVVKGLFSNRAVLVIDGETRLLKTGDRSPEGVLLVESNSREAVVEIDGERHTLSLSRQIAGSFSEAPRETVRIPRSADSHYRVGGAINGVPVTMMVDTGATAVVMNLSAAQRLGVDYRSGDPGRASTAGGIVDSYVVLLPRVRVGGIVLYNVPGAVVMGDFPEQVLLGNSFLSRVSMQEEAGVLVLEKK